ncbi:hypothetical protein CLAFUW4_05179 [Fulvia fulva]|uniref:Uncharacterized protein n=1 Tax=Passalora fulva TaxID=5499 RepID=A0A9Q8PI52_PASFU|nr:uncharacterized protein CLAFUR5_11727 [Fulvia fulva]KAK4627193.1 hypothetical protein CLAFUR4_05165 [Fulvia fulva]KAK4627545.1 hypothetical protein CLAFUR0_05171 [Fulvia fulva]UJO23069.1 hypothetical protein CLAFUR5_11727 [Fulvia fulva]WPV13493.1 hypothetical protein CLAFUW4_05179 [Fulvia fulva]WPV28597.1 hypothetical protein CLAFUW7_05175 [Fulvia fulva]
MSSSLELLCPTSPPPPANAPTSTWAAYMILVTKTVVSALNNRNWSHPYLEQYIAPNLTAYMEHVEKPYIKSREEFLTAIKRSSENSPEYQFEIVSITPEIDEKRGTASVWYKLLIKGHPPGTAKESVGISYCTRSRGNWRNVKQISMRGMGPGDAGV